MQLLIVFTSGLICLSAISAAPPTPDDIKSMAEKCMTESDVDKEMIANAKKGEGLDNKELHCFGACMMKAVGVMDKEGNFDSEVAMSHLPEGVSQDAASKLIDLCTKEKGDDECKTAGLMMKCIHENKGAELFQVPDEK